LSPSVERTQTLPLTVGEGDGEGRFTCGEGLLFGALGEPPTEHAARRRAARRAAL
jgi:hypothetical protein